MPRYDYLCPKCGNFEAISTVNNRHFHECPKCDKEAKLTFNPGGVTINIPLWFHKPIPDSAVRMPSKETGDMVRVGKDDI